MKNVHRSKISINIFIYIVHSGLKSCSIAPDVMDEWSLSTVGTNMDRAVVDVSLHKLSVLIGSYQLKI